MPNEQPDPPPDIFAQLSRAHREIETRVATLERAARETTDATLRASALEAIAEVLAFFEGPAAIHHEDEVRILFPQLRPLDAFAQMLGAFDFQHQMNDATYAELRAAFRTFTPGTSSQLPGLAARFAEMQRAHLTAEERALFPLAARTLSSEVIATMGREMAARRGP